MKPPDLAGYAANADFWVTEVRHRLALIDGYRERFRRFADAQARHGACGQLPVPNLSERDLDALRTRLLRAAGRWIANLSRCGLLDVVAADEFRLQLGIAYGAP